MKKLLGMMVLGLLWCNVGVAEWTIPKLPPEENKSAKTGKINALLKEGFKITNEATIEGEKVFTLRKGKTLIVCWVRKTRTKCRTP